MASYTIVRPESRDAWLEFRKSGIGSSEVGILARVSRFDTPVGLWRKKMGLVPPSPETDVMRAGHQFEPLVAELYAKETGAFIDPTSEGDWLAVRDDKPFMRVSPDRLFWPRSLDAASWDVGHSSILECKTTSLRVSPEDYPKSWFFQVQYQMGVMGLKRAVIAWISSSPTLNFGFVEVPFNPVIFAEIENMITDFWVNHVRTGVMPQVALTSEDASYLWPDAVEEVSVADEEMTQACRTYNELSARDSQIKKELDDIKLKVKTFMRTASEMKTTDGKLLVSWKNCSVSDSFDKDRFGAEHPELYSQYMKTGQSSRRMTFKKLPAGVA